jgi:hypothetical protein
MKNFTQEMTAAGWSWTIWTYKTDAKGGPMGQWGVYSRADKPVPLDPYQDSEADLIAKMKSVRTSNFRPAPGLLEALKQ